MGGGGGGGGTGCGRVCGGIYGAGAHDDISVSDLRVKEDERYGGD